jgi:hypothetical protein
MKEIRIPLDCFGLEAFLGRTIEFLRHQVSPNVDPTYAMVCVERPRGVPVFGPETGWDVLSALREKGKMVFFPFGYTDVDGTLTCADGHTYRPTSDDKDSEEETPIGLEDSIGYLLQVTDGTVIINTAIHAGGGCTGPASRVDLYSDCGVLEEPMEKFIRGFIKG